jgi:hypothetical protein
MSDKLNEKRFNECYVDVLLRNISKNKEMHEKYQDKVFEQMEIDEINELKLYCSRHNKDYRDYYKQGETLKEDLSSLAHEQWSGWMKYLFKQSTKNEDGTVTIPQWAVEKWERQMNTPYGELSEQEQNLDRNEADRVLEIIRFHKEKNLL